MEILKASTKENRAKGKSKKQIHCAAESGEQHFHMYLLRNFAIKVKLSGSSPDLPCCTHLAEVPETLHPSHVPRGATVQPPWPPEPPITLALLKQAKCLVERFLFLNTKLN